MEIYNIYESAWIIVSAFTRDIRLVMGSSLLIALGVFIPLFLLQGFGLYGMAKKRNISKAWLAFVPFANVYFMGKLAGECGFFGHKMKNAGLYAMIAQIISTLFCFLYIAAECYLYYNHGEPYFAQDDIFGTPQWNLVAGSFADRVYGFYILGQSLLSIITLVARLLMIVLLIGLYKKYSPKNYRGLALLSFFIVEARFITVFVLRNKPAIDYEAYMRKMREEYARRYQQYYGNPYGGYGQGGNYGQNGYGGYHQPTQNTAPPPAEPFEEFSSKGKTEDESPSDRKDSDGFFD